MKLVTALVAVVSTEVDTHRSIIIFANKMSARVKIRLRSLIRDQRVDDIDDLVEKYKIPLTRVVMLWIYLNKSEPPEQYRIDINKLNELGYPLAHWWILNVKSEPPSYMWCSPELRSMNGLTCEMLWIKYIKTVPPTWCRHSKDLLTYDDQSLYALWMIYAPGDPPSFILPYERLENYDDIFLSAVESYTHDCAGITDSIHKFLEWYTRTTKANYLHVADAFDKFSDWALSRRMRNFTEDEVLQELGAILNREIGPYGDMDFTPLIIRKK